MQTMYYDNTPSDRLDKVIEKAIKNENSDMELLQALKDESIFNDEQLSHKVKVMCQHFSGQIFKLFFVSVRIPQVINNY